MPKPMPEMGTVAWVYQNEYKSLHHCTQAKEAYLHRQEKILRGPHHIVRRSTSLVEHTYIFPYSQLMLRI